METYQFIKFEGRNLRLEDRITVTKSHSIGFPQKFYQDNNVKNYKYAVLYWDDKNKAIGIKFTNDEKEKNGFSIIHSKIGYGGGISAKSLFKTYHIDPAIYYGRYEWKKYNQEGVGEIFVINLKRHE